MRVLSIIAVLTFPSLAWPGTLGDAVPWVTGATANEELAVNSDDYVGLAEGNPNRFHVNNYVDAPGYTQDILSVERLIPTSPSSGTTEYVLLLCTGINTDDEFRSGFPTPLDSVFQLQLGFGTGESFVRAADVAPDLRFDGPEHVSPSIEDVFTPWGNLPMLELIDQESDTLTYQGRSNLGDGQLVEWWHPDLLTLPIDIPDLDPSLRNLYSSEDLALIPSDTDVPFTIRMMAVPEPAAGCLATLGLLGLCMCHVRPIRARTLAVPVEPCREARHDGYWNTRAD